MLDSMTNGGYRHVPVNDMFRLLDQLAANNSHGTDRRSQPLTTPKENITSSAQMATILSAINKRLICLNHKLREVNLRVFILCI